MLWWWWWRFFGEYSRMGFFLERDLWVQKDYIGYPKREREEYILGEIVGSRHVMLLLCERKLECYIEIRIQESQGSYEGKVRYGSSIKWLRRYLHDACDSNFLYCKIVMMR
ncbi:hypothetical protein ACB098_11G110100 [Castanea mollissima]